MPAAPVTSTERAAGSSTTARNVLRIASSSHSRPTIGVALPSRVRAAVSAARIPRSRCSPPGSSSTSKRASRSAAVTSSMAMSVGAARARSSAARSMAWPLGCPAPTCLRPVAMAMGTPGRAARTASAQRAARDASSVATPASTMVTTRVPSRRTSSCPPCGSTRVRSRDPGAGAGVTTGSGPTRSTAATRCSLAVRPARVWLGGPGSIAPCGLRTGESDASAVAVAAALAGRWAGSLRSMLITSCSRSAGTSGRRLRSGGASSSRTLARTARTLLPSKGARPARQR